MVFNHDFIGNASTNHHFNEKQNLATSLTKIYFLTVKRCRIIPTWVFLRKRCLIFHKTFQHLRPLNMVNFINRNPKINLSLHSCPESHMSMQFLQWAARFYLLIGRILHRYSKLQSLRSCVCTYRFCHIVLH